MRRPAVVQSPVSASASRTPVAEAAGGKTQMTGVVAAVAIIALLLVAPGITSNLPQATLGAVVIVAVLWACGHGGMVKPEGAKELQILGMGLILGYARIRLGLRASILLHFLLNAGALAAHWLREFHH